MSAAKRINDLLESISEDDLADVLDAFPELKGRLEKSIAKKASVSCAAYVSKKPCGCAEFMMTCDYAMRHYQPSVIQWYQEREIIKPIGLTEFNLLRTKCQLCYCYK